MAGFLGAASLYLLTSYIVYELTKHYKLPSEFPGGAPEVWKFFDTYRIVQMFENLSQVGVRFSRSRQQAPISMC